MPFRQPADVVPRPETGIDLLVGKRRKAAVTRGREWREDVDPAGEELRKVFIKSASQAPEIAPEAVRIRDELGFVRNPHRG